MARRAASFVVSLQRCKCDRVFVVFVHGCLGRNTTRFYYAEPLLRPKTLSMRAGCGKKIHKTINVLFACVVAHDSPSNILLMLREGGWEWA